VHARQRVAAREPRSGKAGHDRVVTFGLSSGQTRSAIRPVYGCTTRKNTAGLPTERNAWGNCCCEHVPVRERAPVDGEGKGLRSSPSRKIPMIGVEKSATMALTTALKRQTDHEPRTARHHDVSFFRMNALERPSGILRAPLSG